MDQAYTISEDSRGLQLSGKIGPNILHSQYLHFNILQTSKTPTVDQFGIHVRLNGSALEAFPLLYINAYALQELA